VGYKQKEKSKQKRKSQYIYNIIQKRSTLFRHGQTSNLKPQTSNLKLSLPKYIDRK